MGKCGRPSHAYRIERVQVRAQIVWQCAVDPFERSIVTKDRRFCIKKTQVSFGRRLWPQIE